MARLLWLTASVYQPMRHTSHQNDMHHTPAQALVAVVAQYVLEGNLWLELAMLTRVDMHEPAAVPM
jgi:hypothetical protein